MSETRTNRAPQTGSNASADIEAWNTAAVARGYKLASDPVLPVVGANGVLCTVPAPSGFATLSETVRPFIAQALLQMVQNRIVQTAEGNVQDAVNAAINEGKVPGSQTNDAMERHYLSVVSARVEAARPLAKDASDAAKAEHAKIIEATAIKNREAKFAEFVAAGFEAAKSRPVTEKKRAPKATANLEAAISLD